MNDLALCYEVIQVVPGHRPYTIYAYFNDGTIHYYDAADFLKSLPDGSDWSALQDPSVFKERLTVMNGTAAWDMAGDRNSRLCLDLDPDMLHDAPQVKDPLENINSTALPG